MLKVLALKAWFWTSGVGIIQELVRNAESQAAPQTSGINLHFNRILRQFL